MKKFNIPEGKFLNGKSAVESKEDAEKLISELQAVSTALFRWATENNIHQELALFTMNLRDKYDKKDSKDSRN